MPKTQQPHDDELSDDDVDVSILDGVTRRHDPCVEGVTAEPLWSGDPNEPRAESVDDDFDDDAYVAEPAILPPGHQVMERAAIDAAIAAAGYDGSPGAFDRMSNGECERVRLLLHHRKTVQLFRPHVVGDAAMIARLEQLGAASPNFDRVTQLARRAAHLSAVSGSAIRIPPVLMLGPPGCGKTRFARSLAEALGTSLHLIDGSTIPDTGSLTGYPPAWRGAGPGRIAKALIAAPTSGPLIFVDEAEKIVDYEASAYPLDRLLILLENQSAARFEDEHLRIAMRADRILWLFAANSLDGLSRPFLDRVIVVTIPGLSSEQRDAVLAAMLAEVAHELEVRVSLASADALKPLRTLGLRRCRLAFEIAVPMAIAKDRRFVTGADLAEAVALLGAGRDRPAVGFMPPLRADDER